jgi:beta-glucuronidase
VGRDLAAELADALGAEANRDGPVEEKGTFAFQQDFVNYHLGIYAQKPWLSGAIYFALQEFRVRPDWDGGNPRPQPPIHQKGLVSFDGVRKPAFFDVQRIFLATKQFRAVPRSGL